MSKWEDREYELVLGASGPLGQPANYKFRMQRQIATGDAFFFNVVLSAGNPSPIHPFTGGVLLPQAGKPLIHYIKPDDRLVAGSGTYTKQLGDLLDEIIHSRIEADPDSYERLVGVIKIQAQPINLITFYKVEYTHSLGEVLVIAFVRAAGAAPGGSIGIIGR